MPTTIVEAQNILKICREEHVSAKKLSRLFSRLNTEVGQASENQSVKDTMAMLEKLATHLNEHKCHTYAADVPAYMLAWIAVWLFHFAVITALGASCVLSLLYQPWYISLAVISLCVLFSTREEQCCVTKAENEIRRRLGRDPIDHYSHHYFLKPFKKLLSR